MATRRLTELIARCADDLKRSDLNPQIREGIESAIVYYQFERFWFSESVYTATLKAGDDEFPVPLDMRRFDMLTYGDNDNRIRVENVLTLPGDSIEGPIPDRAYRYRKSFWIRPIPTEDIQLKCWGQFILPELTSDVDANEWTDDVEEMIRARTKAMIYKNKLRMLDMHDTERQLEMECFQKWKAYTNARNATGAIEFYVL